MIERSSEGSTQIILQDIFEHKLAILVSFVFWAVGFLFLPFEPWFILGWPILFVIVALIGEVCFGEIIDYE